MTEMSPVYSEVFAVDSQVIPDLVEVFFSDRAQSKADMFNAFSSARFDHISYKFPVFSGVSISVTSLLPVCGINMSKFEFILESL